MKAFKLSCSAVCMVALACSIANAVPVTANLFLDLNADSASNFALSGSAVGTWFDQAALSGSQDYSQGSSARRPTFQTGVVMPNGTVRNVVDFVRGGTTGSNSSSSSSDRLTSGGGAAYNSATGWSFFAVFHNDLITSAATAVQRQVIFQNRGSGGDILGLNTSETNAVGPSTTTPDLFLSLRDSTYNGATNQEVVGDVRTDVWYAVGTSWDFVTGTAITRYVFSDGTVVNTTQTGGTWASGISGDVTDSVIGMVSTSSSSGQSFDGQIAEILHYNTNLSAEDFNRTMNYLNSKYLAIPEPGSFAFLCIAAVGLAMVVAARCWWNQTAKEHVATTV